MLGLFSYSRENKGDFNLRGLNPPLVPSVYSKPNTPLVFSYLVNNLFLGISLVRHTEGSKAVPWRTRLGVGTRDCDANAISVDEGSSASVFDFFSPPTRLIPLQPTAHRRPRKQASKEVRPMKRFLFPFFNFFSLIFFSIIKSRLFFLSSRSLTDAVSSRQSSI